MCLGYLQPGGVPCEQTGRCQPRFHICEFELNRLESRNLLPKADPFLRVLYSAIQCSLSYTQRLARDSYTTNNINCFQNVFTKDIFTCVQCRVYPNESKWIVDLIQATKADLSGLRLRHSLRSWSRLHLFRVDILRECCSLRKREDQSMRLSLPIYFRTWADLNPPLVSGQGNSQCLEIK